MKSNVLILTLPLCIVFWTFVGDYQKYKNSQPLLSSDYRNNLFSIQYPSLSNSGASDHIIIQTILDWNCKNIVL